MVSKPGQAGGAAPSDSGRPLFSSSFQLSSSQPTSSPTVQVDPLSIHPHNGSDNDRRTYTSAYPPDSDSPFHDDIEGEDGFDLYDPKFRRSSSEAGADHSGDQEVSSSFLTAIPPSLHCRSEVSIPGLEGQGGLQRRQESLTGGKTFFCRLEGPIERHHHHGEII